MEIEPSDDECRHSLMATLDEMRAQWIKGQIPDNGICNTFQYITYYSQILQVELGSNRNFMELFEILFNCLTNPNRLGNVVYRGIPQPKRPCELWERLAEYFFKFIDVGFLPHPSGIKVTHRGGSHDRGVDVLIQWGIHTAVVQVKRGSSFKTGKGTKIINELVGSMMSFNAKIGIVFTNESYEIDVKADAKEIIREHAMQRDLHIHILGETQIKLHAGQIINAQSCKTLMVEFIRIFLK